MKDLKALDNELDNGLKALSKAVKENKQDGSHVLYNLDNFLIEKGYTEDDDIYFAFHSIQDNYYVDDAYGMIDDLRSSVYPQLDEVDDTVIDKLVRQSETLRENYSSFQSGTYPYLHINTRDLFVEYVSTNRACLILQDFKKAILKLEKERERETN